MEQLLKTKKTADLPPKPHRITSVVFILIVVSGVMSAMFAAISVELRGREYLRGRAQTFANSLSAESVEQLAGARDDTNRQEYKELKDRFERSRTNNQDLHYIHLLGLRDGQPAYLVDATPSNSENFLSPGTPYENPSERLRAGFSSDQAFIEGPMRDRFGTWLTAYAPVVDPVTSQPLGLVSIKTPALNYYFEIAVYALVPLSLAAIPLAGLLRDRKLAGKEWEISQLKNQFVSIASHELRSPLTGMLWAIQTLLKESDQMTDRQRMLLMDMFKSAESSTSTINEILDLSVFEPGHSYHPAMDTVELVTALKEVQKTLRLGAQERQLTIEFDRSVPETAYVRGDLSALKRVFMNLISNSIKYSYEGTAITIAYKAENSQHIFSVIDHGIGIPADEQQRVFEGYYRAKNAAKIQAHGTGLGLWITRLIVEKHGGTLRFESKEGKGTTMFVCLPFPATETVDKPDEKEALKPTLAQP